MKLVIDYRKRAAECREIARQLSLTDQKVQLLAMAADWDRLADEREAELKRQSKPKPIRDL